MTVFGASYAMRIWMDPALLVKYGLEVSDVMSAISTQNVQVLPVILPASLPTASA